MSRNIIIISPFPNDAGNTNDLLSFISVYSSTTWLGLRFFRALILLKVTDVLVFVRIIESSSAIKLGNLCSKGAVMVIHNMDIFERLILEKSFYTKTFGNTFRSLLFCFRSFLVLE